MPSLLTKLALRFASDAEQSWLQRRLMRDTLRRALHDIRAAGEPLNTIYDIGAHKGHWALEMRKQFPQAHFELFEANADNADWLAKTGLSYHLGPLAKEACEVPFYATGGTGDSLYRENSSTYEAVQPRMIKAQRLDDIVGNSRLAVPDLIKIDTQGGELDILEGGLQTLAGTRMVYTECPVLAYNIGAPGFERYVSFFADAGFLPHRLGEIHDNKGVLVQVDILFVRRDLVFRLYPRAKSAFAGHL